MHRRRRTRGLALALLVVATTAASLAGVSSRHPAAAEKPSVQPNGLDVGYSDLRLAQNGYRVDAAVSSRVATVQLAAFAAWARSAQSALSRAKMAGGQRIRIEVDWKAVLTTSSRRPHDPTDPASVGSNGTLPDYDWKIVDYLVRQTTARGMVPQLTVFDAPSWAEGADRPTTSDPDPARRAFAAAARGGNWKPVPRDVLQFATALARRYSGNFKPSPAAAPLPRVKYYEAWNEANFPNYLAPQYEGGKLVGPELYRVLLNSFYYGVKIVDSSNVVIAGGTAPRAFKMAGSDEGNESTGTSILDGASPMQWWRSFLCINDAFQPAASDCSPRRAYFDEISHHPIEINGQTDMSPWYPGSKNPDDVNTSNLGLLVYTLRVAESKGLVSPANVFHPVRATEVWWETTPQPLDTKKNPRQAYPGLSPARQAQWMEDAAYLVWRAGGSSISFLQVMDTLGCPKSSGAVGCADTGASRFESYQTGVFSASGRAKPSARAMYFPFVVPKRGEVWGRSPLSGLMSIESWDHGAWKSVSKFTVTAGSVFSGPVGMPAKGTVRLRAHIGSAVSLPYAVPTYRGRPLS